jgi:hypothetical protein
MTIDTTWFASRQTPSWRRYHHWRNELMPDANLRTELESLAQREAEESENRESGRVQARAELQKAEAVVADLVEQLARARHTVSSLGEELEELGPSAASDVRQFMQDRLGLLGRILSTERHAVDSMIEACTVYTSQMADLGTRQNADPSIERDRELVEAIDKDADMLAALPDAVRAVVSERAAQARDRLKDLAIPERPSLVAPAHVAEGPTVEGGHAYMIVLPVSVDAEEADNPHSLFLVNAIAAACQALSHRPEAGVPELVALDDREFGVLISIRDSGVPEEDQGLFAIRLEDQLSKGCEGFLTEPESIEDPLLRRALAELAGDFELTGGVQW